LRGPGRWFHPRAAAEFLRLSGSVFLGGLFASWVLLAVRARILATEGLAAGGQFDAAWTVSMNQAGLVLGSLQTYYLPTLATAPDARDRSAAIARVLMLACGAGAAMVIFLTIFKIPVIELLYASSFAPAARYLRWTLLGDYFKITSWILSIPLLAASAMRMVLAADFAAYATFFAGAWVLAIWRAPAEAAAMAFLAMYIVHAAVCGGYLWRRSELRVPGTAVAVWCGALAAVLLASAAYWRVP
jgi:PST family polysaccharide transporter